MSQQNYSAEWQPVVQTAMNIGAASKQNTQNRKHEQKMLQKQIEYNEAQANLAYTRNLEMWAKTNEYNSPREQMARLKAAGLNPNLAYETSGGKNVTSQPDGYNAPESPDMLNTTPPVSLLAAAGNMLSMYQDYRYKSEQINNAAIENRVDLASEEYDKLLRKKKAHIATHERTIKSYEQKRAAASALHSWDEAEERLRQMKLDNQIRQANLSDKEMENELNSLLKPYGLRATDDAFIRQLSVQMRRDDPSVAPLDIALMALSFFGR